MYKFVLVLALFGAVMSHDVSIGTRDLSTKIFDEERRASPALWRRKTSIAVQAREGEIISGIFVTDRRPKKDGVVEILKGGEKHSNVVLKLKSPTIFRGYDFHIEIYSQPAFQPRVVIPAEPAIFVEDPKIVLESNQFNSNPAIVADTPPEVTSTPAPIGDLVPPVNDAARISPVEITEIFPTTEQARISVAPFDVTTESEPEIV